MSEEEKKAIEIEFSKRLIIEEIKRFSELYKPKEGIGEQALNEIADEVLSFSKNYISKDKIREIITEYQEKAEDVKQKYKGVYAYKDDYLEALAKIEGYEELLEGK
jgi:predicted nucleotidyltransferase